MSIVTSLLPVPTVYWMSLIVGITGFTMAGQLSIITVKVVLADWSFGRSTVIFIVKVTLAVADEVKVVVERVIVDGNGLPLDRVAL